MRATIPVGNDFLNRLICLHNTSISTRRILVVISAGRSDSVEILLIPLVFPPTTTAVYDYDHLAGSIGEIKFDLIYAWRTHTR